MTGANPSIPAAQSTDAPATSSKYAPIFGPVHDKRFGRRLRKSFGSRVFWGTVVDSYVVNQGLFYKVSFDDGDVDILSVDEVESCMKQAIQHASEDTPESEPHPESDSTDIESPSRAGTYKDALRVKRASLKRSRDDEREPGDQWQVRLWSTRLFATIIDVNGYHTIHEFGAMENGEPGELQSTGLVNVGDALFAVGGRVVHGVMTYVQASSLIRSTPRPITLTFVRPPVAASTTSQNQAATSAQTAATLTAKRSRTIQTTTSLPSSVVVPSGASSSQAALTQPSASATSSSNPSISSALSSRLSQLPTLPVSSLGVKGSDTQPRKPFAPPPTIEQLTASRTPVITTPSTTSQESTAAASLIGRNVGERLRSLDRRVAQTSLNRQSSFASVGHGSTRGPQDQRGHHPSQQQQALNPVISSGVAATAVTGQAASQQPQSMKQIYEQRQRQQVLQQQQRQQEQQRQQQLQQEQQQQQRQRQLQLHHQQQQYLQHQRVLFLQRVQQQQQEDAMRVQQARAWNQQQQAQAPMTLGEHIAMSIQQQQGQSVQAVPSSQPYYAPVQQPQAQTAQTALVYTASQPSDIPAAQEQEQKPVIHSMQPSYEAKAVENGNRTPDILDLTIELSDDDDDDDDDDGAAHSFLRPDQIVFVDPPATAARPPTSSAPSVVASRPPYLSKYKADEVIEVIVTRPRMHLTLNNVGEYVSISSFMRSETGEIGEIEASGKVLVGDIIVGVGDHPVPPNWKPQDVGFLVGQEPRPFSAYFIRASWEMLQ